MASERTQQDHEDDWPLGTEPPPTGKYVVTYQRAKLITTRFKNKQVVELHFSVVEPLEWKDTLLVMYCPIPLDAKPGRASKYVQMWELAAGGPATRRDRMTPRVFEGGYWLAEVTHTKRCMVRQADGKIGSRALGTGETGTAVIEHLIERSAGGPAGNQKTACAARDQELPSHRRNAAPMAPNPQPLGEMSGREAKRR